MTRPTDDVADQVPHDDVFRPCPELDVNACHRLDELEKILRALKAKYGPKAWLLFNAGASVIQTEIAPDPKGASAIITDLVITYHDKQVRVSGTAGKDRQPTHVGLYRRDAASDRHYTHERDLTRDEINLLATELTEFLAHLLNK